MTEQELNQYMVAYKVISNMLDSGDVKSGERNSLNTVKNKLANEISKYYTMLI